MMHGGAIVPEGDRVGLPGEAALEFRRLAVAVEHLQERIALALVQAHDVRGEVAIDVERLAAGDGMRAHHRMLVPGEAALLRLLAEAAAIDLRAVMDGRQALAQALDWA